ncbi:MAG: molybdopterin-dependent oxidoreductase [Candidatus Solibacter usitatus]|nr:molybdopterin-dependent oxidoreductase [Candidatus Solibacter usitatus]
MDEVRQSTCALDCPDACALLVDVQDGRAVQVRGNGAHPVTQGFLCGKVTRYLERQYHPERLMHPLRRAGAKGEGRFERITWEAALDEIALRLGEAAAEWGPESVLPYSYAGTMGYLQGCGMDRRFFHRLGASRLDRTICASAGVAGLMAAYGARLGTAPEDFIHSRLIIVWGANIHATSIHLWPFMAEARRRGARLVVIDPVVTRTAALADVHLKPYPGSDLALALGLMHVIFREGLERCEGDLASLRRRAAEYTPERVEQFTGIPAGDVERLAREYATTRPAVIRANYGVQRSERGGRAVQAISLLPALVGSWKEKGGGFLLTTSGAFDINRQALERPDLGGPARTLNMTTLGQALTGVNDPPVKALVVYNSNPAATAPNQQLVRQGLGREDLFTVVLEHFQTDTADWADIVLPATTFLEHTDAYFAYGHYYMQLARPVVAPPGEARPNSEVFRLLARRMGFEDGCFGDTDEDMIRQMLDTPSAYLAGVTLERLEREGFVRLNVPELPFSGRLPDLSGEDLEYVPPVESRLGTARGYPLELVSSKNHDSLNSTFGFRPEADAQTAVLEMHPEDAAARGIADGSAVRVYNARGEARLAARVGELVRPGVVRAPMVRWARSAADGKNVNVLISDRLTDIGGGPVFYNCLVEVAPCEE